MQIPATSTATPQPGDITYMGANRNAGKSTLDADDFMKLLSTQMTAQDPMNPMKDTEFIAQMSSFTSLEQMRTLTKSFDAFATDQRVASAPSYLGAEVTLTDPLAGPVTGIVEKITFENGQPSVVLNGKSYDTRLIQTMSLPNFMLAQP